MINGGIIRIKTLWKRNREKKRRKAHTKRGFKKEPRGSSPFNTRKKNSKQLARKHRNRCGNRFRRRALLRGLLEDDNEHDETGPKILILILSWVLILIFSSSSLLPFSDLSFRGLDSMMALRVCVPRHRNGNGNMRTETKCLARGEKTQKELTMRLRKSKAGCLLRVTIVVPYAEYFFKVLTLLIRFLERRHWKVTTLRENSIPYSPAFTH